METLIVALCGAAGTVSFFAVIALATWTDYRRKSEDRERLHQERMKALELGHAPLDAEVERARAYASAARTAGLIGILLPVTVLALTFAGTLVVVLNGLENITLPLIAAWTIASVFALVIVLRSFQVIQQLPRPSADPPVSGSRENLSTSESTRFRGKSLEL